MSWDAEQLRDLLPSRPMGNNIPAEDELLEQFPPLVGRADAIRNKPALLQQAAIITDCRGRILAWALPNIILPARQVSTIPLFAADESLLIAIRIAS